KGYGLPVICERGDPGLVPGRKWPEVAFDWRTLLVGGCGFPSVVSRPFVGFSPFPFFQRDLIILSNLFASSASALQPFNRHDACRDCGFQLARVVPGGLFFTSPCPPASPAFAYLA